jgi:hypothetical protein
MNYKIKLRGESVLLFNGSSPRDIIYNIACQINPEYGGYETYKHTTSAFKCTLAEAKKEGTIDHDILMALKAHYNYESDAGVMNILTSYYWGILK